MEYIFTILKRLRVQGKLNGSEMKDTENVFFNLLELSYPYGMKFSILLDGATMIFPLLWVFLFLPLKGLSMCIVVSAVRL